MIWICEIPYKLDYSNGSIVWDHDAGFLVNENI